MSKIKRLYFKDLNGLRFFAFLPVFAFMVLFLLKGEKQSFIDPIVDIFKLYAVNSIDFFVFLSSFLMASIALRELKYKQSFSIKKFYARRLLRIVPLLIIIMLFSFYFHDKIFQLLKLTPIQPHSIKSYLFGLPNYNTYMLTERYIYTTTIWSVFMMLQFYFLIGLVLKLSLKYLNITGLVFIGIGIITRIVATALTFEFYFDIFSYGISIGFGLILANAVRNNKVLINKIKTIGKFQITLLYILGFLMIIGLYPVINQGYLLFIPPLFTCLFFSFVILEQTFGKQSLFKLRKSKIISRFGKISYGLLIYTPIVATVLLIGFESVDKGLESPLFKIMFIISTFIISWFVADVSFNTYEKLFSRIKRDFKRV